MNPLQHRELIKSRVLGCYSNVDELIKGGVHTQHKYLRKEGDKYIYNEHQNNDIKLSFDELESKYELSGKGNVFSYYHYLKSDINDLKRKLGYVGSYNKNKEIKRLNDKTTPGHAYSGKSSFSKINEHAVSADLINKIKELEDYPSKHNISKDILDKVKNLDEYYNHIHGVS